MVYYNSRYGGREIYPGCKAVDYEFEAFAWGVVGGGILGPYSLPISCAHLIGTRQRIADYERNREFLVKPEPAPNPHPYLYEE
jgi:hypothetical protein